MNEMNINDKIMTRARANYSLFIIIKQLSQL